MRSYRRATWKGIRGQWVDKCTAGLADTVEPIAARRHCNCVMDYVSTNWTPRRYATHLQEVEREMMRDGVTAACMDWAGGWAPQPRW
jgi:hypothetical protein